MRQLHLLTTAAFIGALVSAGAANAQLGGLGGLGGVAGGLSGGFSGGVGGLGGTLGGSGRVVTDTTRVDRTVRDTTDRTRSGATGAVTGTVGTTGRVVEDARGRAGAATGTVSNTVTGATTTVTNTARSATVVVPSTTVVAPGLGYLGGVDVVEVGRTRALIDAGVTVIPGGQVTSYMDRQVVELRDELRDTGVDVIRRGETIVLELPSDITFAFDKADIRPRFFPVINAVSHTLNAYPATYVDVVGHADSVGSDAYNQRLSERRASSVAAALVDRRALPERLYVEGRGESEPIASNATVQGRAENRRVEIILRPHKNG